MMSEEITTADSPARPTLLGANLLYLICIVLLLTAGTVLQLAHFGWGLLATELMIGALALLATRWGRLPWRETLRLKGAPAGQLLLALLMGVGLWLLDSWLGAVTSVLFGYDVPVPPGTFPRDGGAALLLFVALAVGAPLGEELFFRGYMQRAYERLHPLAAIVGVALLFALFHLSLVGLPPRIPVALALGYVAWRSNSLWPGVVLHAANNAAAALLLIVIGLRPRWLDTLSGTPWAPGGLLPALLGLLLVAGTLLIFHRATSRPGAPAPRGPAPAAGPRGRLLSALPLLLALLLFAGVAALEVVSGRFPELLAAESLELESLPWTEETAWAYRLQHPGGETVGDAGCVVEPQAVTTVLSCELHHEPFDVRVGASQWVGGELTRRLEVVYDAGDGTLRAMDDVREFGDGGYAVTAESQGEELLLEVTGVTVGESRERIPTTALVEELWPWQLTALPFAAGGSYEATLVYPQRYDRELERSVLTVTDVAVVVGGAEPLTVPAGEYLAWRVTVGDETAWYDVDPPHTLLQYDSGPIIWQYQGAEEA